jgi:hypothetical protein
MSIIYEFTAIYLFAWIELKNSQAFDPNVFQETQT